MILPMEYIVRDGNPVNLTDPFGLSPDMELGNYEVNALKSLFRVADYLPIVGTARDIKRSYSLSDDEIPKFVKLV